MTLQDLEPIELVISKNINAEVVCSAIEKAAEKTNPPLTICKDGGPDVNPGVKLYKKKNNTKTVDTSDTAHKVGNLLKHELEEDPTWKRFSNLCTITKQKVQQTPVAYLMPPNQRSKMRFMNIEIPITWGEKIIEVLKNPEKLPKEHLPLIQQHFGWVLEMKKDIKWFVNLITIAQIARDEARYGIHPNIAKDVGNKLNALPYDLRAFQFAGKVIDFLQEQAEQSIAADQTLIGSTEPIESHFGKLKSISGDSNNEFTPLILGSLAFIGEMNVNIVAQALDVCRIKEVIKWTKENIGSTLLSQRRKYLKSKATKEFDFYDVIVHPMPGSSVPQIVININKQIESGQELVGSLLCGEGVA